MEKFEPPTHYFAKEPIPGTEDWKHIAYATSGGGFDWEEFHCWYSPSERQYFWIYGSGCSCHDLSDLIPHKGSFENGSKQDAIRALKRETKEYTTLSPDAIRACTKVIRQHKETT